MGPTGLLHVSGPCSSKEVTTIDLDLSLGVLVLTAWQKGDLRLNKAFILDRLTMILSSVYLGYINLGGRNQRKKTHRMTKVVNFFSRLKSSFPRPPSKKTASG